MQRDRAISGHVLRVDRKRGPAWYAKYRLPDGRQVQKRIGPAWIGSGRAAEGHFTKRTPDDARLVDEAFALEPPAPSPAARLELAA